MQQCPEPEYANVESPVENIKMCKLNRTVKAVSFSVTLKRPWDADIGVIKKFSRGFRSGPLHVKLQ